MMRRISTAAAAAMLVCAAPIAARAQSALPIAVEGHGGLAFPTTEGLKDDYDVGYELGATAKFSLLPMLRVYGGYQYTEFTAKELGGGGDVKVRLKDAGFRAGGELGLPIGIATGFSPYVLGGATYDVASTVTDVSGESETVGKSDRTLGYEVGAGIDFRMSSLLSLRPEVRYRSYKPDFGGTDDPDLSYIDASVGFELHF
jgi:opacity protein-like surface antigen